MIDFLFKLIKFKNKFTSIWRIKRALHGFGLSQMKLFISLLGRIIQCSGFFYKRNLKNRQKPTIHYFPFFKTSKFNIKKIDEYIKKEKPEIQNKITYHIAPQLIFKKSKKLKKKLSCLDTQSYDLKNLKQYYKKNNTYLKNKILLFRFYFKFKKKINTKLRNKQNLFVKKKKKYQQLLNQLISYTHSLPFLFKISYIHLLTLFPTSLFYYSFIKIWPIKEIKQTHNLILYKPLKHQKELNSSKSYLKIAQRNYSTSNLIKVNINQNYNLFLQHFFSKRKNLKRYTTLAQLINANIRKGHTYPWYYTRLKSCFFNLKFDRDITQAQDLAKNTQINIKTYKSVRYNLHLPVRGQRTHTNAKTIKQKLKRRRSGFRKKKKNQNFEKTLI